MDVTFGTVNIVVQVGVIVYAGLRVRKRGEQQIVYWLAGTALAVTLVAVTWRLLNINGIDVSPYLSWLLYIALGVAVLAGIVIALRSGGATRFAWRQGKYAQWRTYRRTIP